MKARALPFVSILLSLIAGPTAAQCPEWSSDFHAAGVDSFVFDQLKYDFGDGEKLYLAGEFLTAGATIAHGLATWDGSTWTPLGAGFPAGSTFRALATYDDGGGTALWAGGDDVLARFDGATWTLIPTVGSIHSLATATDSQGLALFVGGTLTNVDGIGVSRIARYDGSWTDMSGGVASGTVRALAGFDDGNGPALFLGGDFTQAGGVTSRSISRWDGHTYQSLGAGIFKSYFQDGVYALQVFDDGQPNTPALYVGGQFSQVDTLTSRQWARYSAAGWEALPGGITLPRVNDFVVQPSVQGDRLWLATDYGIRMWDGAALTAPAPFLEGNLMSIEVYTGTGAEEVYVGSQSSGINPSLDGLAGNPVLRWNGAQWRSLGSGSGIGSTYDSVGAIGTFDFGAGPELIVGGKFNGAGGLEAGLLARFDGTTWSSLEGNLDGWYVYDFIGYDDGTGSRLYVAGDNIGPGDGNYHAVLSYDGASWSPLGGSYFSETTSALATYDDGSGTSLYVAGTFDSIGGSAVRGIARWNGSTWVKVAGVLGAGFNFEGRTLLVHDDGSGEGLFVGGKFTTAGGVPASNIARYDGNGWSALGAGISGLPSFSGAIVQATATWNSPNGRVLVVGGYIDGAGGQPANGIAIWDGQAWSTLGSGLTKSSGLSAALTVVAFDPDGQGERLYVGGTFDAAGGLATDGIAVWDGMSWSIPATLDTGPSLFGPFVRSLGIHDDGSGRALFMGGSFALVDGKASTNLARFADPCGDDLGLPVCTSSLNSTGARGLLRADGSASLSAQTIDMVARQLPIGSGTLLLNGPQSTFLPLGDGALCVTGGVRRMYPSGPADGSGEFAFSVDFAAPYAMNFAAGGTRYFQAWYRDVIGGPAGFNLTDALSITFLP